MKSPRPRGPRRRLIPHLLAFEPRIVPSLSIQSLGQDGQDLVGSTASPGGDGVQDVHLQLSGLTGAVDHIVVTSPGGFEWATAPDPGGYALAEYFASTTPGQGDLYINPQVHSDQPATGETLPLGGSTGPLITLANGDVLNVSVYYQGSTTPVTASLTLTNLTSPTLAEPAPATPAPVATGFSITPLGQDNTGTPYEQGFVHLVVTAENGFSFNPATFSQIQWELSDSVGILWDSTANSLGHDHLYAYLRSGSTTTADLYFNPVRNETPPAGIATDMTLSATEPGSTQVYAASFAGGDWSPGLLTNAIDSVPAPPPPMTGADLQALLNSASPEYDTIVLPAGATIVASQPIVIPHSVHIIGQGATLLFQQGNTSAWRADTPGAITISANQGSNLQIDFENFTIAFDQSAPLRWSNPAGTLPTLFDPLNNPLGVVHAVIDDRDANNNSNRDQITLSGMTITAPPAFDASSYASLQAQLAASGDTLHHYVGEPAMDILRSNDQDFGSITNCTFQGGPIELFGGPWTVSGNTVLGAPAYTFSPGAFALHSPHDVLISDNQVSQVASPGREFRLVNLAVSGYDVTITGNTFTGGQVGNEVTYAAPDGGFIGINDPEVILAESSYQVLFEGRPAAMSSDGRLLVLTHLRIGVAPVTTGNGLVVSILAGTSAQGDPVMSQAGQWFRVAQQASLSSNGTLELLMNDPLPPPPQGGYDTIEITGGFVNDTISNNVFNLANTSSTAIVFNGEDYGITISNNQITGGTNYNDVSTGAAISLTASSTSAPTSGVAFPIPEGWTVLPNLGAVITGNTIRDSLGGLIAAVQHGVNYWVGQVDSFAETGRVYLTATITGNHFIWDQSFLNSWNSIYPTLGNDPDQSSTPATITVGWGSSAEAPGPYGSPRFPWTVGGELEVGSVRQPIFIDPIENQVTISDNTTQIESADGSLTSVAGATGQVYAGVINGVVQAPTVTAQWYNGLAYYPFNLANLTISGSTPTPPPPPPPPPPPSPPPPVVGPPQPIVPPAPTNLHAELTGLNSIALAWSPSPGATSYTVARSPDGMNWTALATGITSTSYVDSSLPYSTNEYYVVLAVSAAGQSPASNVVSAQTLPAPDVLNLWSLTFSTTRHAWYSGPAATFSDLNTAALASQFLAVINWGDGTQGTGTILGQNGQFVVEGSHAYARPGDYNVSVTVILSSPVYQSASVNSTAVVAGPIKRWPRHFNRGVHPPQHHAAPARRPRRR